MQSFGDYLPVLCCLVFFFIHKTIFIYFFSKMPLNVATDLVYDWYDLGKLAMASLGLDSCLDGCVGSFFASSLWQHKVN